MPYQKTKEGRLVNEVTLGDGYPLSNDKQPLKVGGEASIINVSSPTPDGSVDGEVEIKGNLKAKDTAIEGNFSATSIESVPQFNFHSRNNISARLDVQASANQTSSIRIKNNQGYWDLKRLYSTTSLQFTDGTNTPLILDGDNVQFTNITDGSITIDSFVDEDDMSSNSATKLPTQQSVKAYVDANAGGSVSDADTTTKGIVELATTAETTTGTDTSRAVTPDGLKDGYQGSANVDTVGTIGTGTWQGTAIASAYLDSDTAHLSGTQTFSGKKTFNANLAVNGQVDMQTSENVLITSSSDQNLALHVDGEDKIVISDESIKFETNSNLLKERSAAGGDVAGYGQIWTKNDTPNNLYFTDDTGQDIAITANGHLAQKHIIQINARVYNRYNHWFYPTFAWGTNAENWNSTRSSASLETTWFDSWNPILVVPHNMTLNEYYMYGNSTATHTIEHALLHGTGVTWDDTNADNFSLAQIGSTQSGAWTSGRYNDLGQTGLSVDLAKGDMIMPAFRRTTGDTSSTYSYLEICFVAVCTLR